MLELNKIYCGDSLELLKQLDSNSIQLHLHSPPYAKMKNYGICKGIDPDKYADWYLPFAREIYRTLDEKGVFILNINDCVVNGFRSIYVMDLVVRLVKELKLNLVERLFWLKGKSLCHPKRFRDNVEYIFVFSKSNEYFMDIDKMRVEYDKKSLVRMLKPIKKRFARTVENNNTLEYKDWHPNSLGALPGVALKFGSESKRVSNVNFAVYPESLITYLMKGFSRENDIICDIFSGSGTSCVVAKKLNRRYIGFEIQPEAVEESAKRLLSIQTPAIFKVEPEVQKYIDKIEEYNEQSKDIRVGKY